MAARLIDGRKTVAVAGTAEPLSATSDHLVSVQITALDTNTGTVVVGSSTVVAAAGTRRGRPLSVGESMSINAGHSADGGQIDLAAVYADVTANGDGVSWIGLKP